MVILKPILSVFWTHEDQRARVGWRWGNWLLIRKSHLRAGWIFPYLCLCEGKNMSYVTLVDFGLVDTAWKWAPLSKQHFCFQKINVFKSERWSFYVNIFACNRDHSGVDISVTAWIAPLGADNCPGATERRGYIRQNLSFSSDVGGSTNNSSFEDFQIWN